MIKKKWPYLYSNKNKYHKLPGGGIDEGEGPIDALKREIMEEMSHEVEIGKEIGLVIEYKNGHKKIQISYCYLAKAIKKKTESNYTEFEAKERFQVEWIDLDKAIGIVEQDSPLDYTGKFIKERDLSFLREIQKISGTFSE